MKQVRPSSVDVVCTSASHHGVQPTWDLLDLHLSFWFNLRSNSNQHLVAVGAAGCTRIRWRRIIVAKVEVSAGLSSKPSNPCAATTAEIRRQFSGSARWGPRGVDVVSFYIVSEILDETSKMLHYYEELWGIGILSELFKRIGDTGKSIINSLDGGEEGAHQADSL